MELNELSSALSLGSIFSIETNKTVHMAEGAPAPIMLKVSQYYITTSLPYEPEPCWWNYTNTKSVVVKKGPTPRLYLLCALHKGAGFGKSAFYPMNTETGEFDETKPYSKMSVGKYLPKQEAFDSDYMSLPIDSITELKAIDTPTPLAPKAEEWVFPDKPMNEPKEDTVSKIAGVTVYNPLPAKSFVDLDKECIVPIGGRIDALDIDSLTADIDDVQNSGTLPSGISWGITNRNSNGFADILVDAPMVTEDIIRQLITAKVVTVLA